MLRPNNRIGSESGQNFIDRNNHGIKRTCPPPSHREDLPLLEILPFPTSVTGPQRLVLPHQTATTSDMECSQHGQKHVREQTSPEVDFSSSVEEPDDEPDESSDNDDPLQPQ